MSISNPKEKNNFSSCLSSIKLPIRRLGGHLAVATLLIATVPLNAMELQTSRSTTQAEHEENLDDWWQSDADPIFTMDGESIFWIEPSAGPLDEVDAQECYDFPVEEITCAGEH